ncbi:hypothetical protein [Streptomyces marispadix]|uniref:Uncharacterized protein n=1 Tax=Streptomyces marispadix TaxID=2922868 RepID=A0ABS9SWU8_9ACTN|nr:hypothetical protein [Streptomyces marispadix]MCH6160743.1 hypothetical protein [Streptomyces marispadix]
MSVESARARLRTWGPRRMPVPYVAAWSGEVGGTGRNLTVRADGSGLCYRDETPADRDQHGVLWARTRRAAGVGRPNYGHQHPIRQRQAMRALLCQVCGGPASRTSRGWLFLMPNQEASEGGGTVFDGRDIWCTKPPVCQPCVPQAIAHCPHLKNPVTLRSRRPRIWGVYGDQYAPGDGGRGLTCLETDAYLPYGQLPNAARWFLATQLVLELTRCTAEPLPGTTSNTPGTVGTYS